MSVMRKKYLMAGVMIATASIFAFMFLSMFIVFAPHNRSDEIIISERYHMGEFSSPNGLTLFDMEKSAMIMNNIREYSVSDRILTVNDGTKTLRIQLDNK